MVWKTFHTKDKIERRELTQEEVIRFWKNHKDEECRVELLKQKYEKALTPPEREEIIAQVTNMKPTTI